MAAVVMRAVLGVWLLLGPASFARAQDGPKAGFALSGPDAPVRAVTRESLSALPRLTTDVSFMTSKGEVKGRFEGVLLWTVFVDAGLAGEGEQEMHEALRKTFAVTGRDGYEIDFSLGEIAPEFGDTPAMIALEVDGKPLPAPDGLRLIVPGDKRGARNVRDVASISLRGPEDRR